MTGFRRFQFHRSLGQFHLETLYPDNRVRNRYQMPRIPQSMWRRGGSLISLTTAMQIHGAVQLRVDPNCCLAILCELLPGGTTVGKCEGRRIQRIADVLH